MEGDVDETGSSGNEDVDLPQSQPFDAITRDSHVEASAAGANVSSCR